MNINGFELPPALATALAENKCKINRAQGERLLMAVFGRVRGLGPSMFNYDQLINENKFFASKHMQYYLGTESTVHFPGNIDPARALGIGDVEPDRPIALDYRVDPPRVIYLTNVGTDSFWIELCPNYNDLVEIIGPPQNLVTAERVAMSLRTRFDPLPSLQPRMLMQDVLDENGNFGVGYTSGGVNGPNPNFIGVEVPENMRRMILDAIMQESGRKTYSSQQ